jgi:hypothetical protein
MNIHTLKSVTLAVLAFLAPATASAHLGYTGRTFLNYTGLSDQTMTIGGQTVTGSFGWADGTDADFGDSHKLRIFRFSLDNPALVTISVTASDNGSPIVVGTLLPGFSIYSGLAHLPPLTADHDLAPITMAYLATLPSPAKEGAFKALDTWKLGNEDPDASFDNLTTFTFKGYGVDGTAANFGPTPGIVGDGTADGFVSGTYSLPQGDYSLFVGGADYAGQNPADNRAHGIITTVSVTPAPEPASAAMIGLGGLVFASLRRREK